MIAELCSICEAQNRIIKAQNESLAQLGAVVMEEEKAEVDRRYTGLLGSDEIPDEAEVPDDWNEED